jgi:ribosomal protein S18 acetylase RimI-like enzyme
MSVSLRLARAADLPVLEALFLEFSDWPLQRGATLQRALKDPHGELLVAESNEQVVAFLHQIFFIDPLHAGWNSTITSLFVKEGHRREGTASKLLHKALEEAKRRNVREVHVTTREDNDPAIRLYERHGFQKTGILLEKNP